ncbi:DHH family phosphoesterase [Virgibacillus soli]|uniref:DHH family phosphoesterase n=1 Tax=Paracerasibacillus soli TaxID=480284 RepID=UPI0035E98CD4
MSDLEKKPLLSKHIWFIYIFALISIGIIVYYHWIIGLILLLLLGVSLAYTVISERAIFDETEKYITTLSYRIRRVGEEALLEMPIGIILFNEEYRIDWTNSFMNQFIEEEGATLAGKSLNELSEALIPAINENKDDVWITLDGERFEVLVHKEERLLYLFDRTEQHRIQTLYENEQPVLAIIYLDNYDEVTQNMDDTSKSQLNTEITSVLNSWSQEYGLYLKRTSSDRFLAVGTFEILNELEKSKFNILDTIRGINADQNIPVTISIGIGLGDTSLPVLGELAQSSLDLALGRGGDQVAIKDDSGKARFYGGKTNPMEKRTRVRARVISHALKGLVVASDNVIIMGHRAPDMDAIGSAIGILNIAETNGVNGYIVFDKEDNLMGVYRLMQALKKSPDLWKHFISPDDALEIMTEKSLVVVVDTHKPSMVVDGRILKQTDNKVVIDHHRRGEDFIKNPTLVYMEPYASSTAELVTELIEYQPKNKKLSMLEASALLAGITVDTKSFTLRTGSRTFDAASYLRAKGADTVLVQQFLKEDLHLYIKRSKLIEQAKIYLNNVAIAKAQAGETYDSVLIAQTADTLLTLTGIEASFVISERADGKVGISARSLGDINVQLVMEKMQGGGHLTNAATQIEKTTVDAAEKWLKDILSEMYEGREQK